MADVLIKGTRKGPSFIQEPQIMAAIERGDNPIIKCNGVYFAVEGRPHGWVYVALPTKPETIIDPEAVAGT